VDRKGDRSGHLNVWAKPDLSLLGAKAQHAFETGQFTVDRGRGRVLILALALVCIDAIDRDGPRAQVAEDRAKMGKRVFDTVKRTAFLLAVVVEEQRHKLLEGGPVSVRQPRPADHLGAPLGQEAAGLLLVGGFGRTFPVLAEDGDASRACGRSCPRHGRGGAGRVCGHVVSFARRRVRGAHRTVSSFASTLAVSW
jgi:hypothetical protein